MGNDALPMVFAMVAIAQVSQKVDSCGHANSRFNCRTCIAIFN
jgi:hypothetical protein